MQFYVQMRAKSREPDSPIAITARQLEALIRLAEAEAKMRLSPVVEAEDADRAIRLFMKYLSSVGIDVESGKIDIDIIMTGKPKSTQERMALIMNLLAQLEESSGGKPVRIEDLYKEAEAAGLDRQAVDKAINMLLKSGDIYMPKPGYVKRYSFKFGLYIHGKKCLYSWKGKSGVVIDRLNAIITGLRNAVTLTVERLTERLRELNIEVPNEETIGDWGWSVISKAMEAGIISLSDADIDAMYYVFRRCAILEEMVRETLARPGEVDENFVNNLMDDFRENVEALARVRERINQLLS